MNERTKELAKVTVQYTNDTVAHLERVHNRDFSFDEIDEVYDTKFAELIVQDCVQVINAGKNVWNGTDVPASVALDLAGKNVKAYFGVEE